ncbi:uncharacterized protein [Epargyreus clarus]|uniref:uncharacterized protein isoform X2 n=1 Tax=Epargyreus clarus TaxID=520877 RepID=UPI003C305DCE
MAINSNGTLKDKSATRSLCSSNASNISSCRLIKINFAGKDSCSSSKANKPNNNKEIKSPYLTNDKVQMLSRVTEKKVVHKNPTDYVSSFPLAVSVYKANSDEFKLKKRGNKKAKKSVLTLPNEPAPMPKTYTVSDLNDSECFANDNNIANKEKKRRSVKRTKKPRAKERAMEYYDRDARYCSQLNINLDCSSSEIVDVNGDGERISKLYKSNNSITATNDPHDMWAVLRNINQFQFRPSPPESQESIVPLRKRRPLVRKGNNCKDTRIIETCHTEEFAYISSFEIDSKSQESCSPSSSIDRVTVIDKQGEQDDIMQQFSQKIFGSNYQRKEKNKIFNQNWGRNKPRLKNYSKKVSQNKKRTEDNQIVARNKQTDRDNNLMYCDNPNSPELEPKCCESGSIRETESLADDTDGRKCINKKALIKCPNGNINVMKPTDDSEKQTIGITKVVLSKGQDTANLPKKARLALTLPNTNIPKLTQTEIKRRLANLKFPIVILGKDQITNCAIHVPNADPPQFSGLDEKIWPFMLEWSKENRSQIQDNAQKEIVNIKPKNQKTKHKISPPNGDLSKYTMIPKNVDEPKKMRKNNLAVTNKNAELLFNDIPSQQARKPKSISLLKSKMFQFLNKNTPSKIMNNNWSNDGQQHRNKFVSTNGTIEYEVSPIGPKPSITGLLKEVTKTPVENRLAKKSYSSIKHPWAKGKWASEFIDNIIKKIRSGVYYGVDRKEIIRNKIYSREVSTQTENNVLRNACCQNGVDNDFASKLILNKTDDPLKKLPGFDKTFTTLEIETINTNQIAVKQCVTNVIVQFDIQVLAEGKDLMRKKGSMSCIPIYLKGNEEKIFKCNTSILNASLPAELCSIIPSMMRSILDADKKCTPPAIPLNFESPLPSVSEVTGYESPEVTMYSILPGLMVPDHVKPMLNGRFSSTQINTNVSTRTDLCLSTYIKDPAASILAGVNATLPWQIYQQSVNLEITKNRFNSANNITQSAQRSGRSSNCMALQLYEPRNLSIIPSFGTANFIKNIVDKLNVLELLYTNSLKMKCYRHISNINNTINATIVIPQMTYNTMLLTPISNVGVISLFNAFTKSNHNVNTFFDKPLNDSTQTAIQSVKTCTKCDKTKTEARKKGQPIKILRKKSYVKCYRKCNSMSSISNYKCTQLNKIANLDDFCQALGSNSVCSVLDGCLDKKILGAIAEYEGISYLPASVENQDNLLEELYWIAKTTASDYQKTFDESSEKLLKSLLEKRKKLNPSYLRVMARYVGLGLLMPAK